MIIFPLFNRKKRFYKQCVIELENKSWYLEVQIGQMISVANMAGRQEQMAKRDLAELINQKEVEAKKVRSGEKAKDHQQKRDLDKQIAEAEEKVKMREGKRMESDNKIKILNLSKMEAENEKMYIVEKMIKGLA